MRNILHEFKRKRSLYFMMMGGALFLLIFNYIPMGGIIIAFKDYGFDKGIFGSPWVGFDNFKFFFTSQDAYRITFNTLYLNAIFIVLCLVFSVSLAIIINEIKINLLAKVYQSILFVPYFISWVIVGYFTFALLNMDKGVLNNILVSFGFEPVQWYNEPKLWRFILTIAYIWKNAGYYCVVYLAGLTSIDAEYYEAAKIDGAGRIKQITKITLPLLTPLITIMVLLQVGRIFYADFGLFWNLPRQTGALFSTTDVIDTYVYRTLRSLGDIGMASAAGFYQSLMGFILVMASNMVVKKFNKENALF